MLLVLSCSLVLVLCHTNHCPTLKRDLHNILGLSLRASYTYSVAFIGTNSKFLNINSPRSSSIQFSSPKHHSNSIWSPPSFYKFYYNFGVAYKWHCAPAQCFALGFKMNHHALCCHDACIQHQTTKDGFMNALKRI